MEASRDKAFDLSSSPRQGCGGSALPLHGPLVRFAGGTHALLRRGGAVGADPPPIVLFVFPTRLHPLAFLGGGVGRRAGHFSAPRQWHAISACLSTDLVAAAGIPKGRGYRTGPPHVPRRQKGGPSHVGKPTTMSSPRGRRPIPPLPKKKRKKPTEMRMGKGVGRGVPRRGHLPSSTVLSTAWTFDTAERHHHHHHPTRTNGLGPRLVWTGHPPPFSSSSSLVVVRPDFHFCVAKDGRERGPVDRSPTAIGESPPLSPLPCHQHTRRPRQRHKRKKGRSGREGRSLREVPLLYRPPHECATTTATIASVILAFGALRCGEDALVWGCGAVHGRREGTSFFCCFGGIAVELRPKSHLHLHHPSAFRPRSSRGGVVAIATCCVYGAPLPF